MKRVSRLATWLSFVATQAASRGAVKRFTVAQRLR